MVKWVSAAATTSFYRFSSNFSSSLQDQTGVGGRGTTREALTSKLGWLRMGWHSAGSWHGQLAPAWSGSSNRSSDSSGAIPGVLPQSCGSSSRSLSPALDMLVGHQEAPVGSSGRAGRGGACSSKEGGGRGRCSGAEKGKVRAFAEAGCPRVGQRRGSLKGDSAHQVGSSSVTCTFRIPTNHPAALSCLCTLCGVCRCPQVEK